MNPPIDQPNNIISSKGNFNLVTAYRITTSIALYSWSGNGKPYNNNNNNDNNDNNNNNNTYC